MKFFNCNYIIIKINQLNIDSGIVFFTEII